MSDFIRRRHSDLHRAGTGGGRATRVMNAPTPHNRLGCIAGMAACVAMWAIIAAVVVALVGCGSKPPAAPLPVKDTPISTSGLTKPIKDTAAAGSVSLSWAQEISHANNLQLAETCYLKLEKLG
ncbi:MAG: hypothetical protein ACPG32_04435 [Akkermansiaceae bacterium]